MGRLISRTAIHARKRAVAKTVCYRAVMVAITVAVAWAVVGDVGDAVNIGLVTNVVKTATYYGYERIWDHIHWGSSPAT
ncbi:DUF2061 domain-containing protein [Halorubrum trueperi]|uniref:DUF2061 domain-containing protein n=1 Tax=Halorubrum trueperi TaxID=2004704 RepID=A0ABD5UK09_9EURY